MELWAGKRKKGFAVAASLHAAHACVATMTLPPMASATAGSVRGGDKRRASAVQTEAAAIVAI